jgi:hypothetical protein
MARRPQTPDDLPIPRAEGDLREAFDLPLMAREAERGQVAASPAVSDAAALFDDPGGRKRKLTAAESRAHARRCVRCGGLVPQGMSICATCGTDQESGMRVGLEEDLAPPPPPQAEGPPFHIAVIGGLCIAAAVALVVVAAIRSSGGATSIDRAAWAALALVSVFGAFAAVQFVRGKSAKPLLLALTLGVVVDVLTLVALPIGQTMMEDQEKIVTEVEYDATDDTNIEIKPFEQRMQEQQNTIALGIALVLVYAMVAVYLLSPPVKRYFHFRELRNSTMP